MNIDIPLKGNKKLQKVRDRIAADPELKGYLESANVNAMKRLVYSDHGVTHIKIVANAALQILRILNNRGVIKPGIVENYDFEEEDAEVSLFLAAALHDIGMAVHRKDHDIMGISIGQRLINRFLEGIYEGKEKAIMISETLGILFTHDERAEPLTPEAGILAIADALDMAEGRARIPFQAGKKDIHSVSAMAIQKVEINEGEKGEKPIQILVHMTNSAGIFQVDELLKDKVLSSGLKNHFDIVAKIEGEEEESILKKLEF